MTKTRRQISTLLPLIDAVAELVDARVPYSSRNPELPGLIGSKPLIVLLNKCDIADPQVTAEWVERLRGNKQYALPVDCKSGKGLSQFRTTVHDILSDKLDAYRSKGMSGKPLRIMAVGIPNVGKSSFINRISGGARAKVENRPGVTRGNQWFSVDKQLELLDTPGVLWPRFEDKTVGEHLAFTGAVSDRITDTELLSIRLLEILCKSYPQLITARYGDVDTSAQPYDLLCEIGKKRGMVIRGGETDTERASGMLLEEFRNCKIGRITLERVADYA